MSRPILGDYFVGVHLEGMLLKHVHPSTHCPHTYQRLSTTIGQRRLQKHYAPRGLSPRYR